MTEVRARKNLKISDKQALVSKLINMIFGILRNNPKCLGLSNKDARLILNNEVRAKYLLNSLLYFPLRDVAEDLREDAKNVFRRLSKPNYNQTAQKMFSFFRKNGWEIEFDDDVISTMPKNKKIKIPVEFFHKGVSLRYNVAEVELKSRGYKRWANPYEVVDILKKNPSIFQKARIIDVLWKDANGRLCFISFGEYHDGKKIKAYRPADPEYKGGSAVWLAAVR
ncbi:MAG: hypothetical protein WCV70_00815 [Patescibacteria group bacterium]|jgi:hypothetical protein